MSQKIQADESDRFRRTILPVLREARNRNRKGESARLSDLLDGMGPNGPSILILILSLPFLFPVSLGPITVMVSTVIAALSLTLLFPKLQNFLKRWLQIPLGHQVVGAMRNVAARVARFRHRERRLPQFAFMTHDQRRVILTAMIILHAFLLALPIPLLPLTNTLPALSIVLFSMAVLRQNDLHTIFGVLATVVTFLWFGVIAYLGIEGTKAILSAVWSWSTGS